MSRKRDGFRVSVAQTNDSLRRKAQTEFGLQPFQNQFFFCRRSGEDYFTRAPRVVSACSYFFGIHTTGWLRLPFRSTARTATVSGLAWST